MTMLACTDSGSGQPVVLLHGFPLDRSVWDPQRAAISEHFRLITPDLRGHGRSPGFAGPTSIDAMADDVLALLDHQGITSPVALGGLSMGGYIALSIAVRHPERLAALMLIDTRAAADSPEARENRLKLAARLEEEPSAEVILDAFIPRFFAEATYRNRPELLAQVGNLIEQTPIDTFIACLKAMADRPDRTPGLGQIAVPTLVLAGAEDRISTPEEARTIAAELPRGSVAIIGGAGHMACVEQPSETNQALLRFLLATFGS